MPAPLMARTTRPGGRWDDAVRSWWCILPAVPFGWLTGVGFLYAAVKAPRRWGLWASAAVYLVLGIGGFGLVASDPNSEEVDTWRIDVGMVMSLGAMALGTAHAFTVRSGWLDDVYGPSKGRNALRERAQRLRELRAQGLTEAGRDPLRARELGVGRPDLDGAWHAELVDLNHVPADIVAALPGVSAAAATSLVAAREEVDGFESLDDMGALLDLSPRTLEGLSGRVVFLPR